MTAPRNSKTSVPLVSTVCLTLALAISPGTPAWASPPADPDNRHHGSQGCDQASRVSPGDTTTRTVTSDGAVRTYELHLPPEYNSEEPLPVILGFHGRKGTGLELEEFSGLSGLDAIVAYPNGLPVNGKTAWAGAPYAPPVDDVEFVSDLLDELEANLCVDTDRIFATGKSNGGGFTALLACQMPHRIAAFAPVAGAFYPQSAEGCGKGRGMPVPMMEFHGTDDPIIEYVGGVSHDTPFPAVMDWMQRWVERSHCRSLDIGTIGDDVTSYAWGGCATDSDVVHYRIEGAGHTWPGELSNSGPGSATQTISATDLMWDFFLDHPLRPR